MIHRTGPRFPPQRSAQQRCVRCDEELDECTCEEAAARSPAKLPKEPFPLAARGFAGFMWSQPGDRRHDCSQYRLCLNGATKYMYPVHCPAPCAQYVPVNPRAERDRIASCRRGGIES